jgi:hypothetical protein
LTVLLPLPPDVSFNIFSRSNIQPSSSLNRSLLDFDATCALAESAQYLGFSALDIKKQISRTAMDDVHTVANIH